MSFTVLIAAAEHLAALQQQPDLTGAEAFADTDAIKALDAITERRPQVVALEQQFASSARDTALVNRIKADPALASCEIRILKADGSITLLGRGSVCINTGGEKVFPEEVEEVMKTFPGVADAVAVGVPDEKFGEAITAVVEPLAGAEVDPAELIAHVKSKLASYKAPKHVVPVDTIGRAPNGKVDYKRLKAHAVDTLGVS